MNTVPGGAYKDAVGDGYHDANGNPVDAKSAKEAAQMHEDQIAVVQQQLDMAQQVAVQNMMPAAAAAAAVLAQQQQATATTAASASRSKSSKD